jgi:hypothetical protein
MYLLELESVKLDVIHNCLVLVRPASSTVGVSSSANVASSCAPPTNKPKVPCLPRVSYQFNTISLHRDGMQYIPRSAKYWLQDESTQLAS